MAAQRRAASIPFDQFTEQTLSAVLRAIEAQKLPQRPIIIGIICTAVLSACSGGDPGPTHPGSPTSTFAGMAGLAGSLDGQGTAARFRRPAGITIDSTGSLYVADTFNQTMRLITPGGLVSTIAGMAGTSGIADGTGAVARFNFPEGMASGSLYVADTGNSTIRKIVSAGAPPTFTVSTIAGRAGVIGSLDCPQGGECRGLFAAPRSLIVDSSETVYVADTGNHTIRKIVTRTGVISTLAGTPGSSGSADGTGGGARFNSPAGIAVDGSGTLYVADTFNHTIRMVTPAGAVSTLAGMAGQSGTTDGTRTAARFNNPTGISLDARSENLFVVDTFNHAIRKITLPAGVVTNYAGSPGTAGFADGTGTNAQFSFPGAVAVDRSGIAYVTDSFNNTIRRLDLPRP